MDQQRRFGWFDIIPTSPYASPLVVVPNESVAIAYDESVARCRTASHAASSIVLIERQFYAENLT